MVQKLMVELMILVYRYRRKSGITFVYVDSTQGWRSIQDHLI